MAAQVLYLDVDDEITSAVARIRRAAAGVVVVVPYGSRLASSRINFRLLAREAAALGRPLVVVAPDAGTRALAASAGLPTHATVLEWEQLGSPLGAASGAVAARPDGPSPAPADESAFGPERGLPTPSEASPAESSTARRALPWPPSESPSALATDGGAGAVGAARGPARRSLDGEEVPAAQAGDGRGGASPGQRSVPSGAASTGPATLAGPRPAAPIPVVGPGRRGMGRMRMMVAAVVVLLVAGGAGLAATSLLPSAEITVSPTTETVGPITLTVTGDPSVATTDLANGVVPAVRVEWPLAAGATFRATGKLVIDTRATGSVTFTSLDTGRARTMAAGTVVRTADGIEFTTTAAVNVPRATIITQPSLTISPGTAAVNVTAVKAGPEANVGAAAIRTIANNPDATILSVTNPAPTTGGVHTESPQVQKADVDAALASLRVRLNDAYAAKVADPASIPGGTVLVAQTPRLGDATPSVDPIGLIGQEVASFDLALNATATAIAVNPGPVTGIGERRLAASAGAGYQLIAASTRITVDPPVANGETITFMVRARGERVRELDAAALRALVRGKSIAAARSLLQPFGEVQIRVWPDWVTAIPGSDSRVSLTVVPAATAAPGAGGTPRPSGSPAPASAPAGQPGSPRPSASGPGSGSGSAAPAPSGTKR